MHYNHALIMHYHHTRPADKIQNYLASINSSNKINCVHAETTFKLRYFTNKCNTKENKILDREG